jgi:uncharacterized protein
MKTKQVLSVQGMHCAGCETIIEEALVAIPWVNQVAADFPDSKVKVEFDDSKIKIEDICRIIEAKGYQIQNPLNIGKRRDTGAIIRKTLVFIITLGLIVGLYYLMQGTRDLWHKYSLPALDARASEGMVFMVGLISGLHCIGMCGNFVMGYTAKDALNRRPSLPSHLVYGIGKTLSYALFGAIFGFLGSVLKITPLISAISTGMAGLFLVFFGLSMLNVWAPLKRLRFRQPQGMAQFASKQQQKSRSPFFIGFFSGFLLGCGPLQAMYVMAAGLGDPLAGAKTLALFGLGTLPALFSFGFLVRLLSASSIRRFLQLSGVFLVVMGAIMLNNSLLRSQSGYDARSVLHKCFPDYIEPNKIEPTATHHCH